MEECVHRKWMPPLPVKVIRRHNSIMEKVVKSENDLGFPFMVPDFMYKFQMICLKET